jgi:hypothetical protein
MMREINMARIDLSSLGVAGTRVTRRPDRRIT